MKKIVKFEEAKRLYETANADQRYVLESLFPELKKSEDEKIREYLIRYIDNTMKSSELKSKLLAWLEKQDESYTKRDVDDAYVEGMAFAKNELEKQGEQEYAESPKFKVGDWIINRTDATIMQIINTKDFYESVEIGGQRRTDTYIYVEWDFRLWTIKDAKDGDVLCCESGWTCIFKTLVNDETFSSYCFMDKTKWFCETGSECHTLKEEFVKAYNGNIYPATKEQRDLLFKKMKDAGYEWDAEKKELKKIEQKLAWSEEDEKEYKYVLKFVDNILNNCGNKKDYEHCKRCYDWLKSIKQKIKEE